MSGTLVFFRNWVKACYIGSPDWWICCFEIDVSGCTWIMAPVLGDPNVTAYRNGLSFHWFCSTCTSRPASYTWPKIHLRWRVTTYVSPFKANTSANWNAVSLSSDMARMSHFCRQWRLKPSTSKTISSVFHLHSSSATRELSVYLDGQRIWHECHPTCLGVTLDCTLSYREHLTKTASKLNNRNNLLMKLAGSTWGANFNTLRLSALALCYSAAEYCAPVWSRCAHTSRSMCSWTLSCASSLVPSFYTAPMASSALQHWTASPTKEGCHWQAGGENCQTWQLANPAWYLGTNLLHGKKCAISW